MAIKEEVAHILFHVEAEAKDSDSSQVSGVVKRANEVRNLFTTLLFDNRNVSRKGLIGILDKLLSPSDLKTELAFLNKEDEGQKLRRVFQFYVGKGKMVNRG